MIRVATSQKPGYLLTANGFLIGQGGSPLFPDDSQKRVIPRVGESNPFLSPHPAAFC
jgi:hypothetical protein